MSKPKKPKPAPDPPARQSPGSGKAHVPTDVTRKLVSSLAACVAQQSFIAEKLDIDEKTLRKHYRVELDSALQMANAQVVNNLFNLTKKNVGAVVFWLGNRDKENWQNVQRMVHDAGKGFDLEAIVRSSLGKGGSDAKVDKGKAKKTKR